MKNLTKLGAILTLMNGLHATAEPGQPAQASTPSQRPNVLFIVVDDLRPELGCYGHPQIKSPVMDSLAAGGLVFERAYCQQSLCGPSRVSFLTGCRPDKLRIYGMSNQHPIEWRDTRKGITSLPEQFRQHGWTAVSYGKVYDDRLGLDAKFSWDECVEGWQKQFALPDNAAQWQRSLSSKAVREPVVECADVPDETYTDGHVAKLALEFIRKQDGGKPFFLAVGFPKPHLPFVAPKKYWDLYQREAIRLPAIRTHFPGATEFTFSPYKEIFDYDVINPNADEKTTELIHGYFACISYVDAQIGKIVAALKQKGLYENTIVVLLGDNGWKLGEYGEWAKSTNLELDACVPLIIRLPGLVPTKPQSLALVELLDVLPTVCEAAGIPVPASAEGRSLLPIFHDPAATVNDMALTQYPRSGCMGYSIRTGQWRYTEWRHNENGAVEARELYDLSTSPIETNNVVKAFPDMALALSRKIDQLLRQQIRLEVAPIL